MEIILVYSARLNSFRRSLLCSLKMYSFVLIIDQRLLSRKRNQLTFCTQTTKFFCFFIFLKLLSIITYRYIFTWSSSLHQKKENTLLFKLASFNKILVSWASHQSLRLWFGRNRVRVHAAMEPDSWPDFERLELVLDWNRVGPPVVRLVCVFERVCDVLDCRVRMVSIWVGRVLV